MELVIDDNAKNFLIEKGFDLVFGARPLKRTIQRYLENPLAEEILTGTFTDNDKIMVTHVKDSPELDFKKQQKEKGAEKK